MKILLDTHAAYFYVDAPERLGVEGREILTGLGRGDLVISDISLSELARLIADGTIVTGGSALSWIERFADGFTVEPITPRTAHVAANYTFAHRDPADRQILATAQVLGIPLVTKDRELTRLAPKSGVRVVW